MVANRNGYIPAKDYWDPILRSIFRQGKERKEWKQLSLFGDDDKLLDHASLEKIIEDVKTTMKFTDADMEVLDAGKPRYICMINYSVYQNLPDEGLVEKVGTASFKLTEKGHERVEKAEREKKPR